MGCSSPAGLPSGSGQASKHSNAVLSAINVSKHIYMLSCHIQVLLKTAFCLLLILLVSLLPAACAGFSFTRWLASSLANNPTQCSLCFIHIVWYLYYRFSVITNGLCLQVNLLVYCICGHAWGAIHQWGCPLATSCGAVVMRPFSVVLFGYWLVLKPLL